MKNDVFETKQNATFKRIGIFALSMFTVASAIYLFSPTNGSHADNADVSIDVGAAVNLRLDKDVLAMNGDVNTFITGEITVSVSTNSVFGYTLAMEDTDNITDLTSTTSSDRFASGFTGKKTQSSMENDNWGFSLNGTDFYRIPAKNSPVALKRVHTYLSTEDSTTITIGAKIGPTITAGQYQDQLLFTAYVNGADGEPNMTDPTDPNSGPEPKPPVDPDDMDIKSMQDVQCTLIENVGEAKTVQDIRDGSIYTIKKLADGKCWMVENLHIVGKTLNSATSDLAEGTTFVVPESRPHGFYATWADEAVAYYDDTQNNGAYYNWYTGTAGEGVYSMTTGETQHSICPKGWRLPSYQDYNTLYQRYNSYAAMLGVPQFTLSGIAESFIRQDNGQETFSVWDVGEYGYYMTSTGNTNSDYTMQLYIASVPYGRIKTNGNGYKYKGTSIRCVAR